MTKPPIEWKHMPKSMVPGPEIKFPRGKSDRSTKAEVIRTWMGLSRFQAFFERIESHHIAAWVDKRSIFFKLFVPMFDKNAHIANIEELGYRLRTHAQTMGLVLHECKPVMPMSIMHPDGKEQHGAVFQLEFKEDKGNPF